MNKAAIKAFEDHKVKVVTLSDSDYQAWLEVAKKSSYATFAKAVPNGKPTVTTSISSANLSSVPRDREDRADSYRVHLWLKRGIDLNHRDLGTVDVTLNKGYLVDLAGEIAFAFEDKIVLAAVDKVSRVDGQLTVLASKL